MRHFNSYGPVDCQEHFCVPRQTLIAKGVEHLTGKPKKGGHYFTIWAPRQTGKTWLMRQIQQTIELKYPEEFTVFNFSLGKLKEIDLPTSFPEAFGRLISRRFPGHPTVKNWDDFYQLFSKDEGLWDRPLILLIDEVDTIPSSLIDLMVAQFREMYHDRQNNWLHGLALIGVRAVLGIESQRGSPFNIQKSLKVPNLTISEVRELYRQYIEESGQQIDARVVNKIYYSTNGQPGLVSWFGELLTEKYNPGTEKTLDSQTWELVWESARAAEPNNTMLNIIAKARALESQEVLIRLFTTSNIPFFFHHPQHNSLYLHGIIEPEFETLPNGKKQYICRFTSKFVQQCLYDALCEEILEPQKPVLDLLDDLADVFVGSSLNLPALLARYKDYLIRLKAQGINPWKEQPRRKTDLHLTEWVGHFHLFSWLSNAVGSRCVVSPEFPTGNGKVDLHLRCGNKQGIIEVKSFVERHQIELYQDQAADYAKKLGLSSVTIALFVPVLEETVLKTLSTCEVVNGIEVNVVAIGWV